MKNIVYSIFLLCALNAYSQEEFIIKNVKLFDGETVIENTSVHIKDGIIEGVGTAYPIGLTEIDGTNKTLLPALTNAHVHVFSPLSLMQAAKAGVLNVFDMHGMEMAQVAIKRYQDSTNFATVYAAGAAATVPNGHGTQFGFPSPTLSSPEEASDFVAARIKAGADYIKIIVEPWKATLDRPTITALIEQAHLQQRKAVIHISRMDDATFVLSQKADGLVHIWWDTKIATDTIKKLKQTNAFFVIPTILTSIKSLKTIRSSNPNGIYLSDEEILGEVKKLYDSGVTLLAGTDPPNAGINYGDDLYEEMELLHQAGIPILEVLKAATSNPIVQFGIENKGLLKKGYRADMILVEGDITSDLSVLNQAKTVFKAGKKL